jgi:hypothetical protein
VDIALLRRGSLPGLLPSKRWLILLAAAFVSAATYLAVCTLIERGHDKVLNAIDAQARFAVISVDTKIAIELQQLRELAASDRFQRREFEAFYEEARAFATRTRRQVVLLDVPGNTQIFNTAYPMHVPLREGARFLQKSELDRVRADRPYVSNLFYAPLAQKSLIAVAIPMSEGEQVLYLLGVALEPAEILAAVKDATFAKDTVTLIVDRTGIILARSKENDAYAGRAAPRNMAERQEKSGRMKGTSFDGTPIDLSYTQSELTGWAAVSFARDRRDTYWPLIAALIVALAVIVLGSINAIVANARRRRSAPPQDRDENFLFR